MAQIRQCLINLIKKMYIKFRVQTYTILKLIPHERITRKDNNIVEIFDLYRLGIFPAANSFLSHLSGVTDKKIKVQEVLELVELQAKAEYRPHYHKNSAAIIYIILGYGLFQLGKKLLHYSAGNRIEIPAGQMHGFKTVTQTLFLSIQSPPIINPDNNEIDLHYE